MKTPSKPNFHFLLMLCLSAFAACANSADWLVDPAPFKSIVRFDAGKNEMSLKWTGAPDPASGAECSDHRFLQSHQWRTAPPRPGSGSPRYSRRYRVSDRGLEGQPVQNYLKPEWLYKQHREVLDADMLHLRRPDGRDWDDFVHVNPQGSEKALAFFYNPLPEAITRTIRVPLYYAGLSEKVAVFKEGAAAETLSLDASQATVINVDIPARGWTWLFFTEAKK